MRGIITSSQNGAEDGYSLVGREISNFGKEFYKLSFVRAKASVARVRLTLQTQVNNGMRRGSPPGVFLWYSLSSLDTYSTWEGDT